MARVIAGTVSVSPSGTVVTAWSGATLTEINCPPGSPVSIEGMANFVKQRLSVDSFELEVAHSGAGGTLLPAAISAFTPVEVSAGTLNARTAQVIQELDTLDANGRGLFYNLIGVTGDNDPGPGNLAFDFSDPALVTELYLDVLDANDTGRDVSALIELFTDGTVLVLRSLSSNAYYAFRVVGAPLDSTGYYKISVDYVGHDGSLADEPLAVEWRLPGAAQDVDGYSEDVAGLSAFSGEAEGFRVLVKDIGDGRSGRYVLQGGNWVLVGIYTGLTGPTVTFDIGTVSTLPAGSSATASVTPVVGGYELNLGLTKGDQGIQGIQGIQGEVGQSLAIDASGSLAGRSAYDNEAINFVYVDDDAGHLYILQSVPGGWSDPITFTAGPPGADGSTITTTDGVGDGGPGPYMLSSAPLGLDNILSVTISGVAQYDFTVLGPEITFGLDVPVGVPWQVKVSGPLSSAGDVDGPASSVNDRIAVFDGTSGKLLKDGGASIASLAVGADAIDNTKLANMATARIKGRTTAGTGDPEDLTASDARALLGQSWEKIGMATPAGASSVVWTDLSVFRFLRLRGTLAPSVSAGLGLQLSTDNGATWKNGAADYRREGLATVGGAAPQNIASDAPYFYLNSLQNQITGETVTFVVEMDNPSGGRVNLINHSLAVGVTAGARIVTYSIANTAFIGVVNALSITMPGATLSGRLLLEGVRG